MSATPNPAACLYCGGVQGIHATAPACPLELVRERQRQLVGHLSETVCAVKGLDEAIAALEASSMRPPRPA
jgi:hypothetical protein